MCVCVCYVMHPCVHIVHIYHLLLCVYIMRRKDYDYKPVGKSKKNLGT